MKGNIKSNDDRMTLCLINYLSNNLDDNLKHAYHVSIHCIARSKWQNVINGAVCLNVGCHTG